MDLGEKEYCSRCRKMLLHRVKYLQVDYSGIGQAKYSLTKQCIHCSRHPCMVANCTARADSVLLHAVNVGTSRRILWLPNDLCVCDEHLRLLERVRLYASARMWIGALMLIGPIIAFFLGGPWLVSLGMPESVIWLPALILFMCILGVVVSLSRAIHHRQPKKKETYKDTKLGLECDTWEASQVHRPS